MDDVTSSQEIVHRKDSTSVNLLKMLDNLSEADNCFMKLHFMPENTHTCNGQMEKCLLNKEGKTQNSMLDMMQNEVPRDTPSYISCSKNEDAVLHKSQFEDRVHKPLPARQNSAAYDIDLGDPAKLPVETMNEFHKNDRAEQARLQNFAEPQKQIGLKRHQYGHQEQTQHENNKYTFHLHQTKQAHHLKQSSDQDTSLLMANVHSNRKEHYQNRCHITNCDNKQASYLSQDTLDASNYNPKRNIQETIVQSNPTQDSQRIKSSSDYHQAQKMMKKLSSDEIFIPDKTPEAENAKDVSKFTDEKTAKNWRWCPELSRYNVLVFIVMVLSVMVMHQHFRLLAVERREVSVLENLHKCCQAGMLKNVQEMADTSRINKMANEDVYMKTMLFLGNHHQEKFADRNIVSHAVPGVHRQDGVRNLGGESSKTVPATMEHMPGVMEQKTRETDNNNVMSSANDAVGRKNRFSRIYESDVKSTEYPMESNDKYNFYTSGKMENNSTPAAREIRDVGAPDLNFGHVGGLLVRKIRSPRRKENDSALTSEMKKNLKGTPRNTGAKQKIKTPDVESYEVNFYGIFPFKTHFMNKDCTTNHTWNHGIEACKDNRFIFPHKNTTFPFYSPTNSTRNKGEKKRLIHTNDLQPGKFNVHVPGNYLINLNIGIVHVDNTSNHYLAIHLNDRAVLACQHGGFPCLHRNKNGITKYRICNIVGVLELNKGDILDVRTMHKNVTVRVEDEFKSYFRFILLQRTT